MDLLEAAPRALDVQQFASSRAPELLSLHAALKKLSASNDGVGRKHGILPRHLRRRTTSYGHRRSMQCLYKRKSPSVRSSNPRKKRKLQKDAEVVSAIGHCCRSDAHDISPAQKQLCRRLRRKLEFKPGGSLISTNGTRRLATHVWHAKRFSMTKIWGYYMPVGRTGRGHGSRAAIKWAEDAALVQDASFFHVVQLQGSQSQILQLLHLVLELPHENMHEGFSSGNHFTRAILHYCKHPHSIIAPVLLAWRPTLSQSSNWDSVADERSPMTESAAWLWVHPAASDEAFKSLQMVCNQLSTLGNRDIDCTLREGDMGRIDIFGDKSFDILQRIVSPVARDRLGHNIRCYKLDELMHPDKLSNNAIMYLNVFDPRLNRDERDALIGMRESSKLIEGKCEKSEISGNGEEEALIVGLKASKTGADADFVLNLQAIYTLWASSYSKDGKETPVSEKFLSDFRHLKRLSAFELREAVSNQDLLLQKMKALKKRCTCSIMLLRYDNTMTSVCRWSIILPLSWLLPFWMPLVFAGGHAIGIRESHWLFTKAGLPFFPNDYPDSMAYSKLMTKEAREGNQDVKAFFKALQREKMAALPALVSRNQDSVKKEFESSYECSVVARTGGQIINSFQNCCKSSLLLFNEQVHHGGQSRSLDELFSQGVAWRRKMDDRCEDPDSCGCYVRVLVRPYRKGVVKMGAKLYAPTFEDYKKWSPSVDGWKIIDSVCETVISYDHERSRGKAVGFATSQAPHRSKSTATVAFCEAESLVHARARQWTETKWHTKDIFLLFSNVGSNTLRPSFACVALEGGADI